jgi:hypothetical protein
MALENMRNPDQRTASSLPLIGLLAVAGAARHAACFEDAANNGVGDGLVLIAAHGEDGANSSEDFHVRAPFTHERS